jgi:hypothetical protein
MWFVYWFAGEPILVIDIGPSSQGLFHDPYVIAGFSLERYGVVNPITTLLPVEHMGATIISGDRLTAPLSGRSVI